MVKDVCVIGGGIMGLASAYYLAKRGKTVAVLEKSGIGDGASAACDDMIMMQAKQIGSNLTLGIDCIEMFGGLEDELKQNIGYRPCGGMVLIDDDAQLSAMEKFVERQRACGLDVRIVEKEELHRMQPYVNKCVRASTYCPMDSHIDPLLLLRAYAVNAIALGVEVIRPAEVCAIEGGGSHWTVKTAEGLAVECESVLIAAGAWSEGIGALVDVALPVRPRKGHILITEPIPPLSPTHLWSAAYIASKLGEKVVSGRDPFEERIGHGFVFSRTSEGNHLLGGSREFVGFDRSVNVRVTETIMRYARHYVPMLENVNIIRTIANFRPSTPDGKAIVGEVDGREGLFVLAGHEGDGISLAPLMGSAMAQMMCGGAVDKRLLEYNQRRFA